MIKSFKCKETELIFNRFFSKKFPPEIQRTALRKLVMMDAATTIWDLGALPGNQLETLKGNRSGQYSIRINNQWRICFVLREGSFYDVEIVDYH